MRILIACVVLLVSPAVGQIAATAESVQTPVLGIWESKWGTVLYWDGEAIERAELWRYSHEGLPAWERIAETDAAWHVDVDSTDPDTTWYALIVYYQDGTVAVSDPTTISEYPPCDWLYVAVPPAVEPDCLMPPPWPTDFTAATVAKLV